MPLRRMGLCPDLANRPETEVAGAEVKAAGVKASSILFTGRIVACLKGSPFFLSLLDGAKVDLKLDAL